MTIRKLTPYVPVRLASGATVYAFANNRYQGHAPATVTLFLHKLLEAMRHKGAI